MKKKNIISTILLILVLGIFITGCDKKKDEKKEEPKKEETKITYTALSNERDQIYLLNDNYEKVWSYKLSVTENFYNIIRIDGDYLYYTEDDNLYRRNIKSDAEEKLDIKLKDYWNFHIDGDYLIYDVLYDLYQVNLKTKESTKLTIQTSNEEALINGVLYYTAKKDNNLYSYNLETKEEKLISEKTRIEEYDKDSLIYVTEKGDCYLYSPKEDKQEKILSNKSSYGAHFDYPIHLYNNKVYAMEKDTLQIISDNKEDVYKYELKEHEYINNFIILSENKVLLVVFVEDVNAKCESEICGPQGDNKYILVDIKNKEEKEIKEYIDVLENTFEIRHAYE